MINQFLYRTTTVHAYNSQDGGADQDYTAFVDSIHEKIPALITEGKTDGWNDLEVVNGNTVIYRYWSTQEAAQEWADFLSTLNCKGVTPTTTIDKITV